MFSRAGPEARIQGTIEHRWILDGQVVLELRNSADSAQLTVIGCTWVQLWRIGACPQLRRSRVGLAVRRRAQTYPARCRDRTAEPSRGTTDSYRTGHGPGADRSRV